MTSVFFRITTNVDQGYFHHSKFPSRKIDQSENCGHEIPFSFSYDRNQQHALLLVSTWYCRRSRDQPYTAMLPYINVNSSTTEYEPKLLPNYLSHQKTRYYLLGSRTPTYWSSPFALSCVMLAIMRFHIGHPRNQIITNRNQRIRTLVRYVRSLYALYLLAVGLPSPKNNTTKK